MPEKKMDNNWVIVNKNMTKEGIRQSFLESREYALAKDQYTATAYDNFTALAVAIRDRLIERWIKTQQDYHDQNVKRVYYLSLEFLIGRLLQNNILNLGIWDQVKNSMEEMGYHIEDIVNCELDAGLGNAGLGRLAACFLDSLATLGIPAHGYGIRYDYGIFHQKIINGYQVEFPDEWLRLGNPWEFARPEYTVRVRFYGKTQMFHDSKGKLYIKWIDTEDVLAMPYDIPVPGYKNDLINTLRLWSARSSEEFDFRYFNDGDYERAVYNKVLSENISKVLYPNDNVNKGRELRLKQEYFFTAASIADIIRRFKIENSDFGVFPDKVAIQLNDTHPSLAIVELMRILIDEEGLEWAQAWNIVTRTFAYTNHTVMPEALESWSVPLLEQLLPRHLQIVYEINFRFLQEVALRFPGDNDRLRRMSIIEEGNPKMVRMAFLSIVASHSVNGVSRLHSNLLKTQLFKDFYEFAPARFNNKTNGITQRRWLLEANKKLSDLITEGIGDAWINNLYELEKLQALKDDGAFQQRWLKVKLENKKALADYIYRTTWIRVDPESLFDVQIKRIHEYKRQLLFCFYIISQYLQIKKGPLDNCLPRTFIISGKAAPGYYMAKLIIKFINSVAEVINKDTSIQGKLKVVFLENYGVSLAERIFPAAELSEQMSAAGTEASGTGCMKFMMNGALTIGTLDGANIEIAEAVGPEYIFTFGLSVDEIQELRSRGYDPQEYVRHSPLLQGILRLIDGNFFSPVDFKLFDPIVQSLARTDPYFLCVDFDSYCETQERVSRLYADKTGWVEKSIVNVAKSGKFSSDRTIEEYAKDIWNVPCVRPEK
ncbi:MAG TPA: glycogen/starch/alpha-glucan phosphorylase [Patescibacteria group bacterium]|nr:glycogen/starch/alpha-glucan phosphorylase [Patescibacteria group bacterium]